MQATAVAKFTPTVPSAAGAAESIASDVSAKSGVADFAALLAAQFLGKEGVSLPVLGTVVEADVPLKADDAVQALKADAVLDVQAGGIADPLLQGVVLMPGFAPTMPSLQQATPEIKTALSARSPDQLPGDKKLSVLPGLADVGLESARDKMPALARVEAAEFAVGGKILPPGDTKLGDTKLGDTKLGDTKLGDTKLGDAKLGDAKLGDAKLGDAKLGDAKLGDAKLGDAKLSDAKVADTFKLPALDVDAQQVSEPVSAVPGMMNANQIRATGETKVPVVSVQPPVGSSAWGDAVGQKVVWMAGQHQQVAELHLNPPNLGPMEVRLTISNDQVSALFVSHQPAVREAIEAAMPRLREMFADSGMMLGNAMVSSDSLPQQQNSGQEKQSGAGSRAEFPLVDAYSMPVTARGVMSLSGEGRGMVDLFA